MALKKLELRQLYTRRAPRYDLTANLYYLLGFREWAYRKRAVRALAAGEGDTVVEIGCGTGLNFSLLRGAVGASGRIIGVDLTPAMLERAAERVEKHGWSNVELIRSDAAAYDVPPGTAGILSTFALTLVPEYDAVIRRGAEALRPGGRWVVLDLAIPEGWASHLLPVLLPLFRPFGVTRDLADRKPWESLRRHLGLVEKEDSFFGYVYCAVGRRRGDARGP